MAIIGQFLKQESGAVTVEWVAATFALMICAIGMGYALFTGVNDVRRENNTDFNCVRVQPSDPVCDG